MDKTISTLVMGFVRETDYFARSWLPCKFISSKLVLNEHSLWTWTLSMPKEDLPVVDYDVIVDRIAVESNPES
jgi:hypothetical protein